MVKKKPCVSMDTSHSEQSGHPHNSQLPGGEQFSKSERIIQIEDDGVNFEPIERQVLRSHLDELRFCRVRDSGVGRHSFNAMNDDDV